MTDCLWKVMPLECIRNFHFYRISNDNVAGMRTLEAGASLAPRVCGSGVACGNIAGKSWQL